MKITREIQKQKAIELMKQLNLYKPYVNSFAKSNTVCFFEHFGGFWAYQEPELMRKIKEFEEKTNCLVYAVTHEFLEFGECYDFLYVSNYEEDFYETVKEIANDKFIVNAYVWNKTVEYCSEFGSIGIQSFGGGIARYC